MWHKLLWDLQLPLLSTVYLVLLLGTGEQAQNLQSSLSKNKRLKHSLWGLCCCWDLSEEFKVWLHLQSQKPHVNTIGKCNVHEYPMAGEGRHCSQTQAAIFKGVLSYETDEPVLQLWVGSKHVCVNWASRKIVWITVLLYVWNGETAVWTQPKKAEKTEEWHQVHAPISQIKIIAVLCTL